MFSETDAGFQPVFVHTPLPSSAANSLPTSSTAIWSAKPMPIPLALWRERGLRKRLDKRRLISIDASKLYQFYASIDPTLLWLCSLRQSPLRDRLSWENWVIVMGTRKAG